MDLQGFICNQPQLNVVQLIHQLLDFIRLAFWCGLSFKNNINCSAIILVYCVQ